MLKYAMCLLVAVGAAACGADDGSSANDPHARVACGSGVAAGNTHVCEAACTEEPVYTGSGCTMAGSNGTGHCDQTFTLDTGETGCCIHTSCGSDNCFLFLECP